MSAAADRPALRRRSVLGSGVLGAGLLGTGALLGGCGTAPVPPAPPVAPPAPSTSVPSSTAPPVPPPVATYDGDARPVALCAALANLAAALYGDAVARAVGGRYGTLPAVVPAFLQGAATQHTAAAATWNEVLTAAGRPPMTGTPESVERTRRARLDAARVPGDLLAVALDLETAIAATVVDRIGVMTVRSALTAGAVIAPVAATHAATAAFLLGRPPGAASGPDAAPIGREVTVG